MSPTVLAAGEALAAVSRTSTGEAVVFWVLAPLALAAALAMVLSRSAVHAALWLVLVMFCLAVFYVVQEAPFLGAVQVIVYAGAIMVLFLFVIMLIGVDSSDSLVETLRGHRIATAVLGVGFACLLVLPIAAAVADVEAAGLTGPARADDALGAETGPDDGFNDNVGAIARLLFTRYVWAFEVVSALLVVAAVGAMVLGHRERTDKRTQRDRMVERTRGLSGTPVTPLPGPGVYALHDAVDRPALLPDGTPARTSVPAEFADDLESRLPPDQQAALTGSTPNADPDAAGAGERR